jgi:hypothetical protein
MAKVAFVLHIPNTTAVDLKQIVHLVDALDSSEEDAISIEHVSAKDVLALILSGQYGPPFQVLLAKIEDCPHSPCGDLYEKGHP